MSDADTIIRDGVCVMCDGVSVVSDGRGRRRFGGLG